MIKYIVNISIVLIIALIQLNAQQRDSLIQLYPGMEDTINYIDRTYFGLYNQIEGYEYATVFIRNNEELISRVTFSENGFLKDTVLINDLSILENTRSKIEQIEKKYVEKIEILHDVKVTRTDSKTYEGVFEGFSKNHLYLFSDKNFLTNQDSKFRYKIPVSNVGGVLVKGESDYLTPVLWGAGIGFVSGFLAPIGLSAMIQESVDEDSDPSVEVTGELLGFAVVLALIGAAIGYGIGWLSAEDDVTIEFKSDRSVLRLKDYAMYNFRNLKTLDENYYEIK